MSAKSTFGAVKLLHRAKALYLEANVGLLFYADSSTGPSVPILIWVSWEGSS